MLRNDVGGRLDMTINNLVPEDMANYTCKSRNIAGHHELNGSIYVNCETFLCLLLILVNSTDYLDVCNCCSVFISLLLANVWNV